MRYLIFLFRHCPWKAALLFFAFCWNACGEAELPLTVIPEKLALRDTAGQKSKELLFLKKGDKLQDLGVVSSFETIIQLQGGRLQSPWIKVETSTGEQGWMLAALLLPADMPQAEWLENKRMLCYFGQAITARHAEWEQKSPDFSTETAIAAHYQEAMFLRDTLMDMLARRAEPNETTMQPDFSWMDNLLPGFIAQLVPLRNSPYLFADFKYWLERAQKSSGDGDDTFFETCISIFPHDSIESFFPAWKFQLDDVSSASQLGSGVHLKTLAAIEKNLNTGEIFDASLLQLKDAVFEDIVGKDVTYWQPVEKILAELDKIETANFSCLSQRDRLALQTRRGMFQDPAANAIQVNMRSGL